MHTLMEMYQQCGLIILMIEHDVKVFIRNAFQKMCILDSLPTQCTFLVFIYFVTLMKTINQCLQFGIFSHKWKELAVIVPLLKRLNIWLISRYTLRSSTCNKISLLVPTKILDKNTGV